LVSRGLGGCLYVFQTICWLPVSHPLVGADFYWHDCRFSHRSFRRPCPRGQRDSSAPGHRRGERRYSHSPKKLPPGSARISGLGQGREVQFFVVIAKASDADPEPAAGFDVAVECLQLQ